MIEKRKKREKNNTHKHGRRPNAIALPCPCHPSNKDTSTQWLRRRDGKDEVTPTLGGGRKARRARQAGGN